MTVQAYTSIVKRTPFIPKAAEASPKMTGEELFDLGNIGRTELIRGELIVMAPTGYPHGIIESNFAAILRNFVLQQKSGVVLSGEVGIYIERDPDTVRGADVAYISRKRLRQAQSQSYLDVAPELIVEVLSPNDRWTDVMKKLEEYFAVGVNAVWIADPVRQEIFVYHALTDVRRFTTDDTLSGETVLPGFEISVTEFFDMTFDEETEDS